MKIKGLKRIGDVPEKVKTKSGKVIETGETVPNYKAPDGVTGTYGFFIREAEKGHLHGCLICSN